MCCLCLRCFCHGIPRVIIYHHQNGIALVFCVSGWRIWVNHFITIFVATGQFVVVHFTPGHEQEDFTEISPASCCLLLWALEFPNSASGWAVGRVDRRFVQICVSQLMCSFPKENTKIECPTTHCHRESSRGLKSACVVYCEQTPSSVAFTKWLHNSLDCLTLLNVITWFTSFKKWLKCFTWPDQMTKISLRPDQTSCVWPALRKMWNVTTKLEVKVRL